MDLWRTISNSKEQHDAERTTRTDTGLTTGRIVAVYAHGQAQNCEDNRFKRDLCETREEVVALGLQRDSNQLKTQPHKGRDAEDRAILAQFSDSYDRLKARFPDFRLDFAGDSHQNGCGENLEVRGLTIDKTCLGDVFAVTSSEGGHRAPLLLEVTSPRKPCIRWDQRYDTVGLGPRSIRSFVMKNTLGGVFFRVVREGDIGAGDVMVLQHRPYPEWPISRLGDLVYGHITGNEKNRGEEDDKVVEESCASLEELRFLKEMPQLGIREWKEVIEDILAEREGRESEADRLVPQLRMLQPSL